MTRTARFLHQLSVLPTLTITIFDQSVQKSRPTELCLKSLFFQFLDSFGITTVYGIVVYLTSRELNGSLPNQTLSARQRFHSHIFTNMAVNIGRWQPYSTNSLINCLLTLFCNNTSAPCLMRACAISVCPLSTAQ